MRNTWKDLSILHLGICWKIKDATWKTIWLSSWFQPIPKIWVNWHESSPQSRCSRWKRTKKNPWNHHVHHPRFTTFGLQIPNLTGNQSVQNPTEDVCYLLAQIPRGSPTWWPKKSSKNTNIHNINIHFWKYGDIIHQCHLLWLDMFELTFNRSYSNMCMMYVSSAIPKLPTHGFGGTVVMDQTLALSTNWSLKYFTFPSSHHPQPSDTWTPTKMKDRNNQGIRDQPRRLPKRLHRPDPCWMSPTEENLMDIFMDPYNGSPKKKTIPKSWKTVLCGGKKKNDSVQFGLKRKEKWC